jgi:DNA-3-methyladenine glycosylase
MTVFDRGSLADDALAGARSLVGAMLVRGAGPNARVGRIVEVEAYVGREDLACHARFGPTKRNGVMFGRPGVAYVYLVYGMYNCLNVVVEAEGKAAAVLIRAVEPVSGVGEMRRARADLAADRARARGVEAVAGAVARIEALPVWRLASGPGLVCDAYSINRRDDGVDLCGPSSELRLEVSVDSVHQELAAGPRIGIDYAPEPWRSIPWRMFEAGHRSLSRGGAA